MRLRPSWRASISSPSTKPKRGSSAARTTSSGRHARPKHWVPAPSSSSVPSTARCSSRPTASSGRRRIRSTRCATPPAPATRSRADCSATSRGRRRSTIAPSARLSFTAPSALRSRWRTSASTGSSGRIWPASNAAFGSSRPSSRRDREPLGRTVVRGMRTDSVEGRPAEDAVLVERAQHGDTEAYGELVLRYQALATRTAYVITGLSTEAEDAAQDGFTKAYFALGRFRSGAPFRPWLLRIVANEAKNRRKAAGRRPTVDLSVAEDRPSGDTALSPEAAALASERRTFVLGALRKLREEDRLVIAYRYFMELSEAEMAEALGVARGTVKSRLSRALVRLREIAAGEVMSDA